MQFGDTELEEAEVKVPTSLIDVIFLLLIFFMVTYSLPDIYRKKLDIQLPESKAADAQEKERKRIQIEMDRGGQIALNGETVSLTELETRLKGPEAKGVTAVIRADRRLSHGDVTYVLGLCRDAGITDIAIAVK
jgi:biopolymer transport protein ExbD